MLLIVELNEKKNKMSFHQINYANYGILELIKISSRSLRFREKEQQKIYENAARIVVESNWEYWYKDSKEQYNWCGLRDSILEKWEPFKIGIQYRKDQACSLDPYMVEPWLHKDNSIYYHPLTVHRTIALFILPEMEIEVFIKPGFKNLRDG